MSMIETTHNVVDVALQPACMISHISAVSTAPYVLNHASFSASAVSVKFSIKKLICCASDCGRRISEIQ